MLADIARLDLRVRRRSLIGYSAGMAVYAFVIVALYPTFKDDAGLNKFTENGSTVAALFGASGPLTTSAGWLNANLYANFVPLVVLLLTIGYGAACIAGQCEDGTLGLIATLPVSRLDIILEKAAAMVTLAAPVAIVTAVCVVAGRRFDVRVDGRGLAGITVGVVLLGIDFGLLAMAAGAAIGSRGSALGTVSASAAVSYLLSSLAPVVGWIRPARYASLFFYAVGDGQLTHGLRLRDAAVLLAFGAVMLVSGRVMFERLDVP
jgi:ABC-2 type transport system permease protein